MEKELTARYREDNARVAPGRMFYFWHDSLWQELSTWSHDLPLVFSSLKPIKGHMTGILKRSMATDEQWQLFVCVIASLSDS